MTSSTIIPARLVSVTVSLHAQALVEADVTTHATTPVQELVTVHVLEVVGLMVDV